MNLRLWRVTTDVRFARPALLTCMLTVPIFAHDAVLAEPPVEQTHDFTAQGHGEKARQVAAHRDHRITDSFYEGGSAPEQVALGLRTGAAAREPYSRLAARLRAPVMAKDDDRQEQPGYLRRARVFMAAGDYRRALDACLFHLWEHPSVESYVYLTYLYHAIDGYMEHLAAQDRWVAVEHLFLNLAARGASDVIDPPDVLARMAKEIMHNSLQKQSDVTSGMAARLDREAVSRLWKQQADWRAAHPEDWWAGAPDVWGW